MVRLGRCSCCSGCNLYVTVTTQPDLSAAGAAAVSHFCQCTHRATDHMALPDLPTPHPTTVTTTTAPGCPTTGCVAFRSSLPATFNAHTTFYNHNLTYTPMTVPTLLVRTAMQPNQLTVMTATAHNIQTPTGNSPFTQTAGSNLPIGTVMHPNQPTPMTTTQHPPGIQAPTGNRSLPPTIPGLQVGNITIQPEFQSIIHSFASHIGPHQLPTEEARQGYGPEHRNKPSASQSAPYSKAKKGQHHARVTTTVKVKTKCQEPPPKQYLLCFLPISGTTKYGNFIFELSYLSNIVSRLYRAELYWELQFPDHPDHPASPTPIDDPYLCTIRLSPIRVRLANNGIGLAAGTMEPPRATNVATRTPQTLAWHLLRGGNTVPKTGLAMSKCSHRNYNHIKTRSRFRDLGNLRSFYRYIPVLASFLHILTCVRPAPQFEDLYGPVTSYFYDCGLTGSHHCYGLCLLPFVVEVTWNEEDPWLDFKESDGECYDAGCTDPPWSDNAVAGPSRRGQSPTAVAQSPILSPTPVAQSPILSPQIDLSVDLMRHTPQTVISPPFEGMDTTSLCLTINQTNNPTNNDASTTLPPPVTSIPVVSTDEIDGQHVEPDPWRDTDGDFAMNEEEVQDNARTIRPIILPFDDIHMGGRLGEDDTDDIEFPTASDLVQEVFSTPPRPPTVVTRQPTPSPRIVVRQPVPVPWIVDDWADVAHWHTAGRLHIMWAFSSAGQSELHANSMPKLAEGLFTLVKIHGNDDVRLHMHDGEPLPGVTCRDFDLKSLLVNLTRGCGVEPGVIGSTFDYLFTETLGASSLWVPGDTRGYNYFQLALPLEASDDDDDDLMKEYKAWGFLVAAHIVLYGTLPPNISPIFLQALLGGSASICDLTFICAVTDDVFPELLEWLQTPADHIFALHDPVLHYISGMVGSPVHFLCTGRELLTPSGVSKHTAYACV
ncbi:hypothetical protein M422DRAFT_48415 [Sphaerobolus stellatus SS14]|uniref:Unplaced genomic scaffold SPHSTscaffold_58, whole genome shotgun sequence n=1 Tax=Sphaerobolus stellatus (strain SS14) TaxID=990650 RepID=A0A0C9VUL2_SPHS4|nr:hypothetical protein M422DRAFT_48415 [Sphaerobolus stellatus SS14]